MDVIIISLLIVLVLIGIPTWLMIRTMNKADKNTIVYSPEEVTKKLRKGFYLSFWGIDLLFGMIPSFVLILFDLPSVFQFIVPAVAFVVGFIMFFIGKIQVGLMIRYINFCNRERTEFEEWVLQAMLGIEEAAMRRNIINSITKVIPGVTDDILSAMKSTNIIGGYIEVGKVYTGKNILKNHWPIFSIIVVILISIVITVTR